MNSEAQALETPGWRTRASLRAGKLGWPVTTSAVFLVLIPVVALAAPLIAPQDPDSTNLSAVLLSGSPGHLFGTDELGRDIASRLIYATRISLVGPLLIILFAAPVGLLIAVTAAWRGGRFDSVATGLMDLVLGFPALLLAMLAVAIFGVGLAAPVVALAIAYVPYFARLIRTVAKRERSQPYVSALTVAGYGGFRICLRHIVPNIMPFVVAQALIIFAWAMVDLAAISFLGIGVQPPTADWGSMLALGQNGVLQGAPEQALAAGTMIVLTVISLNIVGEAIADRTARGRQ